MRRVAWPGIVVVGKPGYGRVRIHVAIGGNILDMRRVSPNMATAKLDGVVLAESDDIKRVEGMTYFPVESVKDGVLLDSDTTSRCFWKGKATYFHVQGPGHVATDAAFTYPKPWPLARGMVSDRVAFWREVEVQA